jgi:hypothetical protein
MGKYVLRRKGATLYAPSQDWADLLAELPEGVDLNVNATRARSLHQLGTYWGALDWAVKNVDAIEKLWLNKDVLSDFLQLEVGFVRHIAIPQIEGDPIYVRVPLSKSFVECSQDTFNSYFEAVTIALAKRTGMDVVGLYLEEMKSRGRKAA